MKDQGRRRVSATYGGGEICKESASGECSQERKRQGKRREVRAVFKLQLGLGALGTVVGEAQTHRKAAGGVSLSRMEDKCNASSKATQEACRREKLYGPVFSFRKPWSPPESGFLLVERGVAAHDGCQLASSSGVAK